MPIVDDSKPKPNQKKCCFVTFCEYIPGFGLEWALGGCASHIQHRKIPMRLCATSCNKHKHSRTHRVQLKSNFYVCSASASYELRDGYARVTDRNPTVVSFALLECFTHSFEQICCHLCRTRSTMVETNVYPREHDIQTNIHSFWGNSLLVHNVFEFCSIAHESHRVARETASRLTG